MSAELSLIVAHDDKLGIAKNGLIPWHISADLKHFKKITYGYPIIMGRKTHQTIGQPLPGRTNIVVTRDSNYSAPGCLITHSLDEAINLAQSHDDRELFDIGGGELYRQTIDQADRLYVTKIEGDFGCDTFFPDYSRFKLTSQTKSQEGDYHFSFITLENPSFDSAPGST